MFCIHYICFLVISDFKFADLSSYLLKYSCEVTINGDMKNFNIAEDVFICNSFVCYFWEQGKIQPVSNL